jgi:hypothetical protein
MNSVKKITSIFTIALFLAMWITPLLSATECNMDCCVVPMETVCEMDIAFDSCCPTVSECSEVIYIPVVTAPLLKVNVEKDLTVDYLTSIEIIPSFNKIDSAPSYHLKILTSEVHLGFNTPLLV